MTILQINTVVNTGSTGRIAEEIGQAIIKNGSKSYIAYGRNKNTSKSELIRIGNDLDNKIHGIYTRIFDRHGFASRYATQKLIKIVKNNKPDIIHLHNLHGYYLNIPILFDYMAISDIPIVWTLHDCWPITGHCAHFDYIRCERWKIECSNCPQKREYPSSIGMDYSTENYQRKKKLFTSVNNMTLVPVSKWLEKIIKSSFLKKYNVRTINNGINLETFYKNDERAVRIKYDIQDKFIVMGCAGVWSKRKGFDDFVKLSYLLNDNCRIILVGLSSKQINRLPGNIIGISKTEDTRELAALYSASDVFINPTWEDNFPTTNLEALACGTPVITYNTGGSIESVSPETGFVVEKGDINGLLRCIELIGRNGKEFYSNECIKRAQTLYNKEDRYNDYIKLYENILQNKTN